VNEQMNTVRDTCLDRLVWEFDTALKHATG
jgi:hypothetical protein